MYGLNTINKQNAAAAISKAYVPFASFSQRQDGTILLSCLPPTKTRRQTKTVAGAEFLPGLEKLKTKAGKIADRTLDQYILGFFLPAPDYDVYFRSTGVEISRQVGDEAPQFRVLGRGRGGQLKKEFDAITVPASHTAKRRAAISNLVSTYWNAARRRSIA